MGEMDNFKKLKSLFPALDVRDLDGHGANLYFPDKVITVWWKKRKYGQGSNWHKFSDYNDFVSIIDRMVNPMPKVAHIESQAIKTPQMSPNEFMDKVNQLPWQIVEKHGVQDCIDHILKKRETIMRDQPDNKLAAFCLTLSDELKQYL